MQVRDGTKRIYCYRSSNRVMSLQPPDSGEVGFKIHAPDYFTVPSPFEELGVLNTRDIYTCLHISLPRGYFGMIVNPARDFGNCIVRTDIVENNFHGEIIVSITNIGVTSQSFSGGSVIARLLVISSPVLATPVFSVRTDNYVETDNFPEILVTEVKNSYELLTPPNLDNEVY